MFFAQHIDSIIQVLAGAVFTWMGFRRSSKFGDRTKKIFRVCGPALIVVGSLLVLKPNPAPSWTRQSTLDKVASAQFPGAATPKEATDTLEGVTIKRTSLAYDVPGKDIALFLSYSALPANMLAMTAAERMDATRRYFTSQGAHVLKAEMVGAIHRLTIRQGDNKATTELAIAYAGDNVYRAVASWVDGHEDTGLTARFVASFRLSPDQTGPPH